VAEKLCKSQGELKSICKKEVYVWQLIQSGLVAQQLVIRCPTGMSLAYEFKKKRNLMPTILWVVLILLLLGALPLYPYSSSWGYYPSGGLGLLLVVLLVLALVRRV
jgi:hypothetical protein